MPNVGETVPGKNPAKFHPRIVGVAAEFLQGYDRVLDPFAGSGRVHDLSAHFQQHHTVGVDIEPDWEMEWHIPGPMVRANSLHPPFRPGSFDAIFTSPVYGNRMSDHHDAQDDSERNTYTHRIGHKLHSDNAGQMPWGPRYWVLHAGVWRASVPLLRDGGRFVLNTKDFYRTRTQNKIKFQERVYVTDWHVECLLSLGLHLVDGQTVLTPGNRFGANRDRVPFEDVLVFDKP